MRYNEVKVYIILRQCFKHFLEHDSAGSREHNLIHEKQLLSACFMKAG